MPEWLALGAEGGSFGSVCDFKRGIEIMRVNTALYDQAIDLELIPSGPSGYAPGMLINYHAWKEAYCVIERDGWTESDYLDYARRRLRDMKIKKP